MAKSRRRRTYRVHVSPPSFEDAGPRDMVPLSQVEAIERRVKSLEESLRALSHDVLHSIIHWRCEECGYPNQILRLIARYVPWLCGGCGCAVLDDYRKFHLTRRGEG